MRRISKRLITVVFVLSSALGFSQSFNINGVWLTEDEMALVKIYEENGLYFGKIHWLKESIDPKTGKAWLDKENPEITNQSLPLLGSVILNNFEKNEKEYIGGTVYDSRDGVTYSGKLWLESENSLKMRGYWGVFYKTETWTRIEL